MKNKNTIAIIVIAALIIWVLYKKYKDARLTSTIYGCTNPLADNYNANATITDDDACNFSGNPQTHMCYTACIDNDFAYTYSTYECGTEDVVDFPNPLPPADCAQTGYKIQG